MTKTIADPPPEPAPDAESRSSLVDHVHAAWWREHHATLSEFVAVPSVSPAFDSAWAAHGALVATVEQVASWLIERADLPGVTAQVLRLDGRTPLLIAEIPAYAPGNGADTQDPPVLVYGHLDVQPAGGGWSAADPFRPVLRESTLYGRGTGDDKYVPVAVVSALEALRAKGRAHPRVVLLMETSEESSSVDLPAHLDAHGELLGHPELIVCLDTFVPDAETLWHSSSMRGIIVADLSVAVARQGMHSGMAGGVAPSSFRLMRSLLDRIESSETGICLLPELHAEVPAGHRDALLRQVRRAGGISAGLPLLPGVRPQATGPADQLIAQSWSPSVAYVGVDGMPPTDAAGSVLRESTTVRLSIRLPPTIRAAKAAETLRTVLEADPPSGAAVRVDVHGAEDGWSATVPDGLRSLLDEAAAAGYGGPAAECGGGATVPPLGILARRFPEATVIPLGIVTPASNPHGPDENIDLNAAVRLTSALATLLANQVKQ
ncbi:M20/M25/M40 family metallo-hydrolase [Amycolatopsis sp. GM8]|uniref:M20/M25/M40 family metallo-hydrolase n=1 Tax=Amycolatopsis sp. GM8 TaxID=2896530 RepID=UPI001F296130|nr:M20/M25/M40 family metallo-hydrolase [Amycolatopsis sp. GM8]